MRNLHHLLLATAVALLAKVAKADPHAQRLPKVGSCPFEYYSSGSYCVPASSGATREATPRVGGTCPFGCAPALGIPIDGGAAWLAVLLRKPMELAETSHRNGFGP